MALKATIFKAELQTSDTGRNYYHDHVLTLARHPSENDERMMVRLLAFALHAHEDLTFAEGMSTDDEPALWRKDMTGAIELWIDVGQPDGKRIRKACGRARQVVVYSFSGRSADVWWSQVRKDLEGLKNLTVINLLPGAGAELSKLAQRTMKLQCTIQDGQVWVTGNDVTVHVDMTGGMLRSCETQGNQQ
jgi:uncharacterized protein YaeQ